MNYFVVSVGLLVLSWVQNVSFSLCLYRFGKVPENFFSALRKCQGQEKETDAKIQQALKEDPTLLLTLGKLREFFKNPNKSPKSYFRDKIRINAVKFNGIWYEIHDVPNGSFVDLNKLDQIGQLIPPIGSQRFYPRTFKF